MSSITIPEMIDEILAIEKNSIKKRKQVVNANTVKYGRNKADADVVNDILAKINDEGIGDED